MSVLNILNCPHCSRQVSFPNSVANMLVCTCGNVVYKDAHGRSLARIVPVIFETPSGIQCGSEGLWKGKKFIVTGRFRVWFEEFVFNYWTLDFADENIYYLAEGYGLYAIYEALSVNEPLRSSRLSSFNLNNTLQTNNHGGLRLLRRNEAHYWEAEGAFYKRDGKFIRNFETLSEQNEIITVFEYGDDITEIFSVSPVAFEELGMNRLAARITKGKKFICESCATEIHVQHYPYTQSWVCLSCGERYSLLRTLQVKRYGNKSNTSTINIALGTLLHLDNTEYTVTGFAYKEDTRNYNGTWKEYTLFNPEQGFAFLNESDGNWIFLREKMIAPPVNGVGMNKFQYENETYSLLSKYRCRILYAAGEFPGNIFNDSEVYAYDFVSPPQMWSLERSEKEGLTWFYGTKVNRKALQKQVNTRLPAKRAPSVLSYGNAGSNIPLLIRTTLVLLLLAIGIHLLSGATNREKVLLDQQYSIPDSASAQTFVTDHFTLTAWKSNLEFEIQAPVDNSWFEMGATLINTNTGDEYTIEQGVEYYHGYTDGENWSEGGQFETAYLSSIPAGNYFLQINGSRDQSLMGYGNASSFHVKVTNEVSMFRNLMLTIVLMLIYPAIVIYIKNAMGGGR